MRNIVRLGFVLTLICGVAAAGLAAVYNTTLPRIEAQREAKLQEALRSAVPAADDFQRVEVDGRVHYVGISWGVPVGAAVLVSSGGYGSDPIEMLVGLDAKGKVLSVVILNMSETPGIGTRVKEASFLGQFIGKSVKDPIAMGTDIDGISGATISSRAVAAGVRKGADLLKADFLGEAEPQKIIDFAQVPNGDYDGEARGFGGIIKVRVTVSGGRITKIAVLQHSESPGISDPAISGMPARVMERQGLNVDVVSSATITSKGILAAVEDALKNYIIVEGGAQAPPREPVIDLADVPDGTYRGQAAGLLGPITVEVKVAGGKLVEVRIISDLETPSIAGPAFVKVTGDMVAKNTIDVDNVTGATGTVNGVKNAVKNALAAYAR
ncbi:MAG: FMN-binding protein [Bacillota bacterium]